MPLRVRIEQEACLPDGGLVQDAGHHVLQWPPLRRMVMHLIGGEDGKAVAVGERVEPVDTGPVVAAVEVARRDVPERGKCPDQAFQVGLETVEILPRQGDELGAVCVLCKVAQGDLADPLFLPAAVGRGHLALGEQGAEAAIGLAVPRIGEERLPGDEFDPAADDRAHLCPERLSMDPYHPGHGVEIGHPDGVVALRPGGGCKVHRIRGTAQKRKAGGDAQLDDVGLSVRGEPLLP